MKFSALSFYLLLMLTASANIHSQSNVNNNLAIKITDLRLIKDSIEFRVNFTNIAKNKMALFKPDVDYVNYGLISITLKDLITGEKYHYDHGPRGDLDNIFLQEESYIILNQDETFVKQLKLSRDKFVPKVAKGNYEVEFMLDYRIANFTFPCEIKASVFKYKSPITRTGKLTL